MGLNKLTITAGLALGLTACGGHLMEGKPTIQDVQSAVIAGLSQGGTNAQDGRPNRPFESCLKVENVSIVDTSVQGTLATVIATADVRNITSERIVNNSLYGINFWDPNQTVRLQPTLHLRKYDSGWRQE
jgi:hypothetical protein